MTFDIFPLIAIPLAAALVIFIVPLPNRLALGITVAACLVGSSLLIWLTEAMAGKTVSPSDILLEWLQHIATALVTVAILELYFHLSTLKHLELSWRSTLGDVLTAKPEGLISILRGSQRRGELLDMTLKAETNTERGDFIRNLLQQDLRFRSQFDYRVQAGSFSARDPNANAWMALLGPNAADEYYLVKQRLRYESLQGVSNTNGQIEVRFVFGVDELEASFRTRDVFFRELLQVEEACRARLRALSPDELKETVIKLFGFRALDAQSRPLSCSPHWATHQGNHDGSYIRIIAAAGGGLDACTIEFELPQAKSIPYFLMQLNEPTFNPSMEFSHEDPDVVVTDFPFFPEVFERHPSPLDGAPRRYEFKLVNKWVYPRSGILFAWHHGAAARPSPPAGPPQTPAHDSPPARARDTGD